MQDSVCERGITPTYDDCNAEQGIQSRCSGIALDRQYIDVTWLKHGTYELAIFINPFKEIAESTYDNNGVTCLVDYTPGGLLSEILSGHILTEIPGHLLSSLFGGGRVVIRDCLIKGL